MATSARGTGSATVVAATIVGATGRAPDVTRVLVGIGIGIMLSLVGREAWGWLPKVNEALIRLGTFALPRSRRAFRREEYLRTLTNRYDERRLSGMLWSIGVVVLCTWQRGTGLATELVHDLRRAADRRRRRSSAADRTALVATGLSAAFTAISVAFTLYDFVRLPPLIAVLVGAAVGIMIGALDLALIPRWFIGREAGLALAVPRALVAFLLAFLVVTPVTLRIFQPEIAQHIAAARAHTTSLLVSRIDQRGAPEIARLHRRREAALQRQPA